MGNFTFGKKLGLPQLALLLIAVNLLVIYYFEIEVSRIVRLGSCLALLSFVFAKKRFGKSFLSIALIILVVRDVAILFYEETLFKTISLFCTILVYTLLCLVIFKKLPTIRFSKTIVLVGLGIVILNIFNVYYLSDIIISSLDNEFQLMLFFTQSAVMLFMALFAFLYNESFEGNQSLHMLLCVIAFIFSDLGGLAAYFFEYTPAFYAERSFYLIATVFLVDYIAHYRNAADQLSEINRGAISIN
ncbi:MAG TPA: hypothetical protein EYN07_11235 [Flavobacteriaceae bacterium]|jgi:hypothetical protein|nr:hypothetical protein [Flavobacteriaceae bacterium]MAY52240.1 hypothetical protein [Flavobacteriaceae bacterium]HBR55208.1 hypothetical protein [Flavobacteriaceae bacterium]HIB48773.1 hypothetical protein [Flavobacteriaceae bacterium]HIN99801.1 hypothetical protein [Flavobacteriaceae bacterium]|tara:strand:+ start:9470 stop:10204 length:735 start_codon:yes stop_codon:yes gene_type:complete